MVRGVRGRARGLVGASERCVYASREGSSRGGGVDLVFAHEKFLLNFIEGDESVMIIDSFNKDGVGTVLNTITNLFDDILEKYGVAKEVLINTHTDGVHVISITRGTFGNVFEFGFE